MNKIKLIVVLGCLIVLLVAGLMVETYALRVEMVDVPIIGLPPAFEGFRIVQISDLHGRRFSPQGKLVREAAAATPDLIVLTGDYVHNKASDVENVIPFLQALPVIAPVYAVSGNHEHWTDWSFVSGRLADAGIAILDNRYITIERGKDQLILAGVGDPYTRNDDLARALPVAPHEPIILLAHSPTWFEPTYMEHYGQGREKNELLGYVSLTLTGHTHGGQIKLPFIGAVTTASGRLFPKSHVEGLIQEGDNWLYINRGVGQGGLAVRFMSRPEMTVITLIGNRIEQ
jgi:uncharacterized protein